ncbi:lipolytic enzyme [Coprinopsis marcescibilis]|uniref:Lipolytic enzyme n=1 Tax=Coprinopsis marcescibilis TaxID=230819 RepID=A0A5C3KFB8_COPMA|nr:lipolytic enzyme [Coprinopsis marcescibilis]
MAAAMVSRVLNYLFIVSLVAQVCRAQVPLYGQCGGSGWGGQTQCIDGTACVRVNEWYSQCQPGSPQVPAPSPVTSSTLAPTVPTTTVLAPPVQTGPITALPLGDSITHGQGSSDGNGYRKFLKDLLLKDGIQIDYIGTQKCGTMQDNDCQGHHGNYIDQISDHSTTALTQRPQVVLLKAGTVDVVRVNNLASAPNRLMTLIDKIFTASPNTTVLVATIVPFPAGQANADRYNTAVRSLVEGRVIQGQHVVLVSMAAVTSADLPDGIHPNDNGYQKMAQAWYSGWTNAKQKGWVP